jgi:hypothetical protein
VSNKNQRLGKFYQSAKLNYLIEAKRGLHSCADDLKRAEDGVNGQVTREPRAAHNPIPAGFKLEFFRSLTGLTKLKSLTAKYEQAAAREQAGSRAVQDKMQPIIEKTR